MAPKTSSESLTRQETETIRNRILERSGELRADIRRELEKYDDERYADLADRVSDVGEHSVADLLVDVDLAEITRDVEELRALEAALMRLATGHYGTCTDCGQPIDAARLHYSPGAQRCLACQERFEQQHPGTGHPTL
jgi:DnaK suppressor protein